MGVPKFYRWISERYPCLSQIVREHQIPEFDNLYLDMNGIIHVCSHPNDDDPHFRISEEKIFGDMFHYLEVLFSIVKPKKVFYMAVDGVAPRAKMNQQRGRRFRTAKDAEDLIRKAEQRGESLPKEARFDSNCITPGTEFMARIHTQLQYFVNKKVTTDRQWRSVRVILSGHDVPGEGEHKIMDFIRWQRAQADYDPNTRHCLYGLDADLMMLGLTSHEPHFSLLREEVRFGGKKVKKRVTTPEETTFHLLHLSLMREYIDHEFSAVREKLPFPYDLEKIIDDWVLMGFLVGNDFIPHLPNFHINHDALPYLYKTYMSVLPFLDGYLNENGDLNLPRFETYMRALSKFDYEQYDDVDCDFKWLEGKRTSNNSGKATQEDDYEEEIVDGPTPTLNEDIPTEYANRDEDFHERFLKHKKLYYHNKLGFHDIDTSGLNEQAKCYVVAIQWILYYYYQGVPSWSWFFPYHYAPFLSDIRNFANIQIEFDLGKPFRPFEQLLAVLPPASKTLLPVAYQSLMVNEDSPIIRFYPTYFDTDLNGKRHDWEAVVLIPFIDESQLLSAMAPLETKLLAEEKERNTPGHCFSYRFNPELNFVYKTNHRLFPDITACRSQCETLERDCFAMNPTELRQGLCEGVQQDVYFPGFPTLKHLQHSAQMQKGIVRVFQMMSHNDSIILNLQPMHISDDDAATIARDWLNKPCYVFWPHLTEALVVAVTTDHDVYTIAAGGNRMQRRSHSEKSASEWKRKASAASQHYAERKGVKIGPVKVLIEACLLQGTRYDVNDRTGHVSVVKQWESQPSICAFQTCLKDIFIHTGTEPPTMTLEQLFPIHSECFLLSNPHYGSMVKVVSIDRRAYRVQVKATVQSEPNFEQILAHKDALSDEYRFSGKVADGLGISPLVLSRIASSLQVERINKTKAGDKQTVNIGLNFKFSKRNEEMLGYARYDGDVWKYSRQAEDILAQYVTTFSRLFAILERNPKADVYKEQDLQANNLSLSDISEWLRSLPCHKADLVPCGSKILDDMVIQAIEAAVNIMKKSAAIDRSVTSEHKRYLTLRVRPNVLYRPSQYNVKVCPDRNAYYNLFDRVVCVRDSGAVPLALKGTIIGVHGGATDNPLYEVLFDEPFLGGMTIRCSPNRAYKLPPSAFINISHGKRLQASRNRHLVGSFSQPSHVEHQQYNHTRSNQKGQVILPSKSHPTSSPASYGASRNARQMSETSGSGLLPPRLMNQGKVRLMTRKDEKPVVSKESDLVSHQHAATSHKPSDTKEILESRLIDINDSSVEQILLVDINDKAQLNSDWVKADAEAFGLGESPDVLSESMATAMQELSQLEINVSSVNQDVEAAQSELDVVVEGVAEAESESEKEKTPDNTVEDPSEVLKRILNVKPSAPQHVVSWSSASHVGPNFMSTQPVHRTQSPLVYGQDVSSFSVQLAQWCHLFKLPPPTYQYIPQPMNHWICVVGLETGQKFKSHLKNGRYEAAESASMVALQQLPSPIPHHSLPLISQTPQYITANQHPPFHQPFPTQSQPPLFPHQFQSFPTGHAHAHHKMIYSQSPTFGSLPSPPIGAIPRLPSHPMSQPTATFPYQMPHQQVVPPHSFYPQHQHPVISQRPFLYGEDVRARMQGGMQVPRAMQMPYMMGSDVGMAVRSGGEVRGIPVGFVPLQVTRKHPETAARGNIM
ncbi:5'-3' exoribonuclease 1-like isoform X2 [Corticium candelabrum]|uniref:5'-3' exoribonuclease 1-like isoform X2 n=1 Tax=Corticium candelabrum TaxID=121492 RepID=UPI002E25B9CE|nr:5'-3' exoribonuclease 1-like isoform X2 [Corticium candelabrum]